MTDNDSAPAATLSIWGRLERTDPNFTKKAPQGLTAINPEWQFKQMTEVFGPCGFGWGWELTHSEIVEMGHLWGEMDPETKQRQNLGPALYHTARVKLWYLIPENLADTFNATPGARCEIEGTGHTAITWQGSEGPTRPDGEFEKKSITDAVTKAMSALGMTADVRMGMYEQQDYVIAARQEVAQERAEAEAAEAVRQKEDFNSWYSQQLDAIREATTHNAIAGIHNAGLPRLQANASSSQIDTWNRVRTKCLEEIRAKAKVDRARAVETLEETTEETAEETADE